MGSPQLRYESGQTAYPFQDMTDSGDRTTFSASFSPISQAAGAEAVIAPYGLLTGGAVIPAVSGNDDEVDSAALTASMAGATGAGTDGVLSVAADTAIAISRGVTTDTHRINSITVTAAGVIAAVAGVDNTEFSENRGADGGPPFIPVGSIEIAQVRTTSVTAAPITAGEIFSVPGLHRELSGSPTFKIDYVAGTVTFADALPAIHTGSVPKKVSIKGGEPSYATLDRVSDWSPAASTYSITSKDTYDGPIGSSSASLNQASFSAILDDGMSDPILSLEGQTVLFEFRQDRDKLLPKQITQGILGVQVSFPAGGGKPTGEFTVSPDAATRSVLV